MDAFIELRRKARENRDKAIAQAQDEYSASLVRIAELEQDLLGRNKPKHKSIAACIERCIPQDRTFSTADVMAALEAIDSRRVWRKRSVDNHISRLRAKGLVRRLRKAHGHEPALYARVGVHVEPQPFEGKTLADAIEVVLRDRGPMGTTQLAVALMESGFHTTMKPKAFRDAVGVVLRKSVDKFIQADGNWQFR